MATWCTSLPDATCHTRTFQPKRVSTRLALPEAGGHHPRYHSSRFRASEISTMAEGPHLTIKFVTLDPPGRTAGRSKKFIVATLPIEIGTQGVMRFHHRSLFQSSYATIQDTVGCSCRIHGDPEEGRDGRKQRGFWPEPFVHQRSRRPVLPQV